MTQQQNPNRLTQAQIDALPADLRQRMIETLENANGTMDKIAVEADQRNASAKFSQMIQQYTVQHGRRPEIRQLEEFKALIRKSGHPNYY